MQVQTKRGADVTRDAVETIRAAPTEEEQRRMLMWLVDERRHGGPLVRQFAATAIDMLAWYEEQQEVLADRNAELTTAVEDALVVFADTKWAEAYRPLVGAAVGGEAAGWPKSRQVSEGVWEPDDDAAVGGEADGEAP